MKTLGNPLLFLGMNKRPYIQISRVRREEMWNSESKNRRDVGGRGGNAPKQSANIEYKERLERELPQIKICVGPTERIPT